MEPNPNEAMQPAFAGGSKKFPDGSEEFSAGSKGRSRRSQSSRPSRLSAESLHGYFDFATECLLYAILILTPWVFGTTEVWSIKTMNVVGFLVGGLLIGKMALRKFGGVEPERWVAGGPGQWVTRLLFALTVLVLGYCAVFIVNARGEFIMNVREFVYFDDYKKEFPHSYDRSGSVAAFQMYLACACFFWGLRDWLITRTEADGPYKSGSGLPARLRRLLWVVCVNACVLGLQGMLQRLSHTESLLWMVRPIHNNTAPSQFGPFAYRSNGAQYLNLIWPTVVGFWWSLHRASGRKLGESSEVMLIPIAGFILAATVIANSRGGIAIAIAQGMALVAFFAYAFRSSNWWKPALASIIFVGIIASVAAWQWPAIQARLNENSFNTMSGRTEIYANTERMVDDFPLWGSGPGTFSSVYLLYRENPYQRWYAMTHNDFLQTRATFGVVGLFAVLSMFVLTLGHSFLNRGVAVSPLFVGGIWVALLGCMGHARFDFPLQIYSILLVFLTLCAILTVTHREAD
jgi:O-antigen ligase